MTTFATEPTSDTRTRTLRSVSAPRPNSALQRPLASYYLLIASTVLLLVIGFVMVLSASSVRSFSAYHSSYAIAVKQGIFIAVGLPAMWVASRMPVKVWRRLGPLVLLGAIVLLFAVLVPHVGRRVDGATRWIPMPGGFNLQPSEFAKLGLALWGADLFVRKRKLLGEWKHLVVPLAPVTGLIALLVLREPDYGTTLVIGAVFMSLLWVVGAPGRLFGAIAGVAGVLGVVIAVAEPYRVARLTHFLNPCNAQQKLDHGFQACQGLYALSSGGWFGVGLGASREKWAGGLPNPYTDYVFAILGEETGLLGTLAVLLLFGTLVYAGIRVAKRTTDPFSRLAATGVTAWIAAQAMVNIGAVVGLLPITGIPLPLISFGGSALVPTLVAIGMLVSIARNEPGAAKALRDRGSVLHHRTTRRRPTAARPVVPAPRAASAATGKRTRVANRRPNSTRR